jgi:trimethylamine--corrinoid protein Co-methyltransferase
MEEHALSQTETPVGLRASLYRPLSEGDVKTIAGESYRILEQRGMTVYSQTCREALKAAGAEVDENSCRVKMPRALVEDAVATNPSSITLCSRDGTCDAVLEGTRVHYGTGGTAIYVLDPDTGERRSSNVDDVALNAAMVEALENIHVFTINVFPHEVEEKDDIDPNRFFHALSNTKKHVMGGIYSLEGCKKVVRMAEMIAGSAESLRERPFVSFITLIISPFKIDDHYGEMTAFLAQKNLPVVIPTEPICGTTSPVTLAGNVLMHMAETLGGIVMVQSIQKGAPGICGSVGSITDLRTMNHVGGAVERAMINAAVAQLAQYFEIPLYSTGGTSDAKSVDVQAAYESAMSSLLVAMSGANYIHDIAGLMEADLTVSYEKLVIDNEILGMCQRVLRGIEVNADTLATELIIEKGPEDHFAADYHTVEHMLGEFFEPTLANRDKRASLKPDDDAYARAKRVVAEIRGRSRGTALEPEMCEEIRKEFPEIHDLEG